MLVGTHLSYSAKDPHALFAAAKFSQCDAFQIFLGSPQSGITTKLSSAQINAFNDARSNPAYPQYGRDKILVHAPYSINLARTASDSDYELHMLRMNSIISSAAAMNIGAIVLHPGSTLGRIPLDDAIKNIVAHVAANVVDIDNPPRILYENMCGTNNANSNVIGRRFGDLVALVSQSVSLGADVGICIDTAHLFSSGVDIRNENVLDAYFRDFNRVIGPQYLRALHLNDSACEFSCGIDKHMPIGAGTIGIKPFKWIMNNPQFRGIPLITETHIENSATRRAELMMLRDLCA
jgi:apurinic endonuclease APN1